MLKHHMMMLTPQSHFTTFHNIDTNIKLEWGIALWNDTNPKY